LRYPRPARPRHDQDVSRREKDIRVLIVDDAPSFRRAARALLERRGYTVVGEADCCAAALDLVGRLAPDAVLLDVQLPDGNGYQLSAVLTDGARGPAVLLVSAAADLRGYALVEQCGARGLVDKADLAQTDLAEFWPRAA
jgi:DNA-binding NarL/FixJ family response regulator